MLTLVSQPQTATVSAPKAIVAKNSASSQVFYTLAAGKRFKGFIQTSSSSQSVTISSNGVSTEIYGPISPTYVALQVPIELVGPATFTSFISGGTQAVIGIETDA
jgi:hypothetical protein